MIKLLTDKISLLAGKIGMSIAEAITVESAPNRMNAIAVEVFVTITESPPPVRGTFADVLVPTRLTVPVGRKGLTEPCGMVD